MDGVTTVAAGYKATLDKICVLDWISLDRDALTRVAWAYYFFSIQFRENLEIAHAMYPNDTLLTRLMRGECDTDNLSPWPDVAAGSERMNHDEFMRRLLQLNSIDRASQQRIEVIGRDYLAMTRAESDMARAMSITSFEDGGLERVFTAMIKAQCWDTPLLKAFHHFLVKHIEFDSDPEEGHGALARHLTPDERIAPLWEAFYSLFVKAVPSLERG